MVLPAMARVTCLCLSLCFVAAQETSKLAFLEEGYCSDKPNLEGFDGAMDIASMDCAKIMEFVFISRWHGWSQGRMFGGKLLYIIWKDVDVSKLSWYRLKRFKASESLIAFQVEVVATARWRAGRSQQDISHC